MSKFRCPDCFRPNSIPESSDKTEISCNFCEKTIGLPKPTYAKDHDLSGFIIQEWLGNGSLGEIYLASQTSIDDRPTALKIVTNEHINSEEDMQRFFREIKLVAQLSHKHIATAFIAGKFEDGVYLASQYVEGKTLDDILAERDLSEEEIIEYSKGIASALKYAWEKHNILHRDLKPTNFMVDDKSHIFLVDMCVAKSLEILSDNITLQGNVMGTPYYISPEQASAEEDLDERTDMYGLGATMFQMVTGKPPFFNEGTHLEITAKKLSQQPEWPEGTEDKYSKELLDFIMRILSISREDRPGNWSDVIENLESLGSKEEETSEDNEEEVKDAPTEEESTVAEEDSSDSEESGSNPKVIIAVVIIIILVVLIAIKLGK